MRYFFLFFTFLVVSLNSQETEQRILQLKDSINNATVTHKKISLMLSLAELEYDHNFSISKQIVEEAIKLIGIPKDSVAEQLLAKAYVVKGVIKRREADYPAAISYYIKAKEMYEAQKDKLSVSDISHNMAMVYRYQNKHKKAITFYKKSIQVKETLKDTHGIAASYNMMGVSYRQTKRLDSALVFYNKAKTLFASIHSNDDIQRVNNNMVALYLSQNKYEQALKLLYENIRYAKTHDKKYSLCVAYRNASNAFKKQKDYQLSLKYIDSSLQIASKERFRDLLARAYLRKSFLYARMNNYKGAYDAYRTFNRHSDSIHNIENIKKIQALELAHQFEQEKREVVLLAEAEASKKALYKILFSVTGVGAIIILTLFYLYYRSRSKALKEKLEKEQIQKELLDEKVKANEEETKKIIADNTMRLEFKQQLLDRLKKQILPEASELVKQKINSLTSELQLQVQTEEKLTGIQTKISEVNKGFDAKLRAQFPTLTKTEREICSLLRLNLSIKEIMTVRNASIDAIKSARYRIRKKLGLQAGEELENFIQNI